MSRKKEPTIVLNAEIVDLTGYRYFIKCDVAACWHLTKLFIKKRVNFSVSHYRNDEYSIQIKEQSVGRKIREELLNILGKNAQNEVDDDG